MKKAYLIEIKSTNEQIAVEYLNVRGMIKNRYLSKTIVQQCVYIYFKHDYCLNARNMDNCLLESFYYSKKYR
ncbi:hypothetical protein ABE15_10700 [Bacillus cereus]|nr:hypothetical protein [Bacillus cereus]